MGVCLGKKKGTDGKVAPQNITSVAELKNQRISVIKPKAAVPTEAFTFATDQPFTLERIVQATYQNPDRKKPKKLPWFWPAIVYDQNDTAEYILNRIKTELEPALKKFNEASIMSHDVNRLSPGIPKESWLSGLKGSAWTGPYKWEKGDHYHFQSVTQGGTFDGLTLTIRFDVKEIMLSYTTQAKYNAGAAHIFMSN